MIIYRGYTQLYQSWLASGNTGTINDFFLSLRGPQGPQGPQGGSNSTIQLAANVTAGQLVAALPTGGVPYSVDNLTHMGRLFGIALTSGSPGQNITCLTQSGMVAYSGLTAGTNYGAALAGALTDSQAVGAAFIHQIGKAQSNTQFYYSPAAPIQLL